SRTLATSQTITVGRPVAPKSQLSATSDFASRLKRTFVTVPGCPLRHLLGLPLRTSQTYTVLSRLPDASVLPSLLNVTQNTEPWCARRFLSKPETNSQSVTVSFEFPVARYLVFGLNAKASTISALPASASFSLRLAISQILIVAASITAASELSSQLNA